MEELIYWLWSVPKDCDKIDEKQWLEFTDELWKEWEKLVEKRSELNNDKAP